jgi:hypothetical protein
MNVEKIKYPHPAGGQVLKQTKRVSIQKCGGKWTELTALKRLADAGVKFLTFYAGKAVKSLFIPKYGLGNGSWGAVDFLKRKGYTWMIKT